ncbi:MAG TPA: hypothetical protein VFW00_06250 [Rhodocyclaceae bacterium]|nr:hypothetical protein [Rhodocyclaceae bacterium]
MLIKILLALREGRERIGLIRPNGSRRPVLGTLHPQEDDRRASIPARWGWEREAPRKEALAAIEEPLPVRTQTILSHGVSPEVRQVLNGGVTDALPASRQPGSAISVKLDL